MSLGEAIASAFAFILSGIAPLDTELDTLFKSLHSTQNFESRYAKVVREAMDYVIDGNKMGRSRLAEAEKAEKTIFGMKIEAYLRHEFGWARGSKLDFYLVEIEFDSKATIGKNWMIPREAVGEICLLTRIDEETNLFQAGLLRATADVLTAGSNQDKKKSVSAAGKNRIQWLISDGKIPRCR